MPSGWMRMQSVKADSALLFARPVWVILSMCDLISNSLQSYNFCCVFCVYIKTPAFLSHPLCLSLTNTHSVGCSTFYPSSPIHQSSLYPSICGRDEVTICCTERTQKGLRGREWETDRVGESVQNCDVVNAVKVELNRGEEKRDMCDDSVTAVKGTKGLKRIERMTEKEKQREGEVVWYCHCSKAESGRPLAFDLCLLHSVFVWVWVYLWFIVR